jgi:hypothetical protein
MTKRLFYLSLSLLCLVAAYQLGADRAGATWDPNVGGEIVGGWAYWWYTTSGEAWSATPENGWERDAQFDLPVPASQVKFIQGGHLLTIDDVAWSNYGDGAGWRYVGPFPGGPVPLETDSWGKVKERYRD